MNYASNFNDPNLGDAKASFDKRAWALLNDVSAATYADRRFNNQGIYHWKFLSCADLWYKIGNPFFIDEAFELVFISDAASTPAFQLECYRAIQKRRKASIGLTYGRAKKRIEKNTAFQWTARFIWEGLSLSEATKKAVPFLKEKYAIHLRASTLEKDYPREFSSKKLDQLFHSMVTENGREDEYTRGEDLLLLKQLPSATGKDRGERR